MSENEPTQWVGRFEERSDQITPSRVAALCATLDHPPAPPADGEIAPPGTHWTLFPSLAPESELAEDGHPRRGGFLPPIALPRRMWAGGRLVFHRPLRVGQAVDLRSTITAVEKKRGRSGHLFFVTVSHVVSGSAGILLEEQQELVYREMGPRATSVEPADPAPMGIWSRTVSPTATLLFRYSALTFNAHRIHYDGRYATEVEGYPGLVVHAPLLATLLLDLLGREQPDAIVERFSFRALRPTFDTSPFELRGAPGDAAGHVRLWSTDNDGRVGMEAEAFTR